MHESCTYPIAMIFMNHARILSSEVFIFHAHYCECIIFILGAYCHHWGSNSQAPKMMFSPGLETMGHGAHSKVLTDYTIILCQYVTKKYTKKHNLFHRFLFVSHFHIIQRFFYTFLTISSIWRFLICISECTFVSRLSKLSSVSHLLTISIRV